MNRKKTGIVLLIGGAVAALWYVVNQVRDAGLLNFVVKNVNLSFQGVTPILRVNLGIQNPSNSNFTVKAIAGSLYSNGYEIGQVSAFDTINIAPTSETVYPLFIRMSILGVVQDIVKLFSGGGLVQQVEFDGAVNANGHVQPLNFKYSIGG